MSVLPFLFVALNPQPPVQTPQTSGAKPIEFKRTVVPLVKKYCVGCHAGPKAADGIDLTKFKTQADVDKNLRLWRKVGREVGEGHMPPSSAAQPNAKDRKTIVDYCNGLKKPQ